MQIRTLAKKVRRASETSQSAKKGRWSILTTTTRFEDKDVFQQFYTTKLSKRLIHGVSASDEAEASMISKLKEACGFEYTNKLQRMFTGMPLLICYFICLLMGMH